MTSHLPPGEPGGDVRPRDDGDWRVDQRAVPGPLSVAVQRRVHHREGRLHTDHTAAQQAGPGACFQPQVDGGWSIAFELHCANMVRQTPDQGTVSKRGKCSPVLNI